MEKPNDWNMSITDWPNPDIISLKRLPRPDAMDLKSIRTIDQRPLNMELPMDDVEDAAIILAAMMWMDVMPFCLLSL
jgi:hypothetical protein